MNPITLLQPPRLVFGEGCALQAAGYLAGHGVRKALLVSSSHVLPHLDHLLQGFAKAGVALVSVPPVDAEPTMAEFERLLEKVRRETVEVVLGVGGGSVIDVAKLLAALMDGRQSIREVVGIDRLKGRKLLLVCMPTTAGTGAEVSPNAILLDENDALKKGVVSAHLVPDAAYVDPVMTWTVPPDVTAATGLDALTHCIEAYANKFAHPMVDHQALQGIRLISGHLLRAVRNGRDGEARSALALGSLYGGLCLGPVNTAAVHALAYPLGGRFHVAHGVSNALLLPHVLQFNFPAAAERYADIAEALGLGRNSSSQSTAELGVGRLRNLVKECGVPQRLSQLGIPREALPEMARAAMQVVRLLKNNPRTLSEQDALQIYEAAY